MKTLAELEEIRQRTLERIQLRREDKDNGCAWWWAWPPAASQRAHAR